MLGTGSLTTHADVPPQARGRQAKWVQVA